MQITAQWKKAFWVVPLLIFMLLVGCSGGNEGTTNKPNNNTPSTGGNTATNEDASKEAAPVSLSIMSMYSSPNAPASNSDVMKALQELTNTKLDINWVPNTAYNEKLTAILAAQELPNIILTDLGQPAIVNAIDAGMFWELGPYLEEYPNLSRLDPAVLNNASYKGKTYGVYRARDKARGTIFIRKDWLDNMKLEIPTTPDELLETAIAFGTGDPDNNGKQDTVGWVMDKGGSDFRNMLIWLGGPNDWKEENGELIPSAVTPEYLDTMNYFRKLYVDGGLNRDFLLVDSNQKNEVFYSGKAGIYYQVSDGNREGFVKENDPEAEVLMINRFDGPAGILSRGEAGFNSLLMIPKTSVKTEEHLRQVLSFIDGLGSMEGQLLLNYGIEGTHYDVIDGYVEWKDEEKYKNETGAGPGIYNLNILSDQLPPVKPATPQHEKAMEIRSDNENFAVFNPAAPYNSATFAEIGATLEQIIEDAKSKFILGELDETGWQQALDKWRSSGGDKYIEEINEEFRAAQQ